AETRSYRIVGTVDGTTLTYTPSAPPGAPTTLNHGQAAFISGVDPFVVASQDSAHPFYFGYFMPGIVPSTSGVPNGSGPELVTAVPPEQFMNRYVVFTVPTLSDSNFVVVREKSGGSFLDVSLDCAGTLSGWTALGSYQWTSVNLAKGFTAQGSCDN